MPDNLDIVPTKFMVKDGKELREAIRQGHICFPRR